jgi:hypothetical protein
MRQYQNGDALEETKSSQHFHNLPNRRQAKDPDGYI